MTEDKLPRSTLDLDKMSDELELKIKELHRAEVRQSTRNSHKEFELIKAAFQGVLANPFLMSELYKETASEENKLRRPVIIAGTALRLASAMMDAAENHLK